MATVKNYFTYNSYISLMKDTKKYKELFSETASWIALIMAIIFSIIIILAFNDSDLIVFTEKISAIIITLAAGLIGLLGFLISGLAVMISVISKKAMKKINLKDNVDNLVNVLFSYYFAGSIILITIFDFLLVYFILMINSSIIVYLVYIFIICSSYLFSFSLAYSVALLGTCINIFFVSKYFENNFEITNEK